MLSLNLRRVYLFEAFISKLQIILNIMYEMIEKIIMPLFSTNNIVHLLRRISTHCPVLFSLCQWKHISCPSSKRNLVNVNVLLEQRKSQIWEEAQGENLFKWHTLLLLKEMVKTKSLRSTSFPMCKMFVSACQSLHGQMSQKGSYFQH